MNAPKRARKRAPDFSREEILNTARNLFATHSYEGVTIRQIASAIGCAPGTIYLHFADKAEIFEKLCEETFSKLSQRMSAISNDDDDPLECLRRGGRTYANFALEHPSHYIVTFVMAKSRNEHGPKNMQAGLACFENLRRMVDRCVQAGQLRITNVDEVSQILWTSLHGMVTLLITHGEFPFLEPSRLIERHLEVLIEGIRV
jgi:AcrR family transcriptional regulator